MQPQSSISQRAAAAVLPQAPTLAPLRFVIPSSSAISTFNRVSVATSVSSSSTSQTLQNTIDEPEHEPLSRQSVSHSQGRYTVKTEQQQLSLTSCSVLDGSNQVKKITPKRMRNPKLASRSTKSKARPGLRKGKWTEEESRYAAQLITYFKEGLLPLERGTMLRLYLSQKLNCEPMRITKKFTGGECIGKQVFRPCSPTPDSRVRIMQAQVELIALEADFIKRLKENREDPPISTGEFDVQPTSSSHKTRHKPLKPRIIQNGEEDADDANAVGLLLDFFYKATKTEKKGDESASATKRDEGAKLDKQEDDAHQIEEAPVQIAAQCTTATDSETDSAINSPTKRMRALSVSGFVDSTAAKRSRIGSISTVTAA